MASTESLKKKKTARTTWYLPLAAASFDAIRSGRHPLLSLIVFAVLGICTGVDLSSWEDDGDTKGIVIKWLGLLCDRFIRALKCIVLPLIFVSVTFAVLIV
jgi:L-cystine uptake protein TcyP (sodium:dicarboxylate symporter family)